MLNNNILLDQSILILKVMPFFTIRHRRELFMFSAPCPLVPVRLTPLGRRAGLAWQAGLSGKHKEK